MFNQPLFNSKDLGDMLKLLPGVVVQKELSAEKMAVLYRIEPVLLRRFINSTLRRFESSYTNGITRYKLDDYLSGFLQDSDRSQLYYCDPMLQHISICRHILSLKDGTIGPES